MNLCCRMMISFRLTLMTRNSVSSNCLSFYFYLSKVGCKIYLMNLTETDSYKFFRCLNYLVLCKFCLVCCMFLNLMNFYFPVYILANFANYFLMLLYVLTVYKFGRLHYIFYNLYYLLLLLF